MRFLPGDVISDKFRVLRLLGEGGMGVVYEGENVRIGRRVAIKILQADVALDADAKQRFEQEARACARVHSPHVVEVLDLGDLPDGRHYLVMEYLEGETLGARLDKRGTLTVVETARIAEQVTRGLAALHDVGILHRDIKPVNLFLVSGADGEIVKILDFGIAKSLAPPSARSPKTATGALMGTPRYMSPEQARGMHRLVDERSDLYALGVVLYECLTAHAPFEGENQQDLMFRIALGEPRSIESFAPGVDAGFAAIVRRAMARAPEHRFASARELHAELVLWARGQSDLAGAFSASIPVPAVSTPPRASPVPRDSDGAIARGSRAPSRHGTPTAWGDREPAMAPTEPASAEVAARAAMRPRDQATRAEGAVARSSAPPRASAGLRAAALVAALGAAGGLALFLGRRGAHEGSVTTRDAALEASLREIVAVTDIPTPATTPAAGAHFAAALRVFRDGNTPAATARLGKALEEDPKLGEAYVQRALMSATDDPVGARADYLRALELRDGLGPRDEAIVKALGPCVLTEPTDFRACIAGLAPLRASCPRDTEILFFIASIEAMAGDVDTSTDLFREALRLDPGFGFAWARVGQDEAYNGRFEDARRSFVACLDVVSTSTFCRMNRLWVNDQEGDPTACEADARALTVIAPNDTAYLEVFPQAIAAQGHPREAVEDALRPLWSKWAAVKAFREPQTRASVEVLDGRFDVARPALEEMQERYAANRDPWRWLLITRTLFTLLDEVGDVEATVHLAENLSARLSVLPTNQGAEDWAMAEDPVPLLYEARFHARALSRADRDAQRDAWLAGWRARTTPTYARYLWVHGYATYASTPEEAVQATGALPSFGGIPAYRPKTATNADIGRTLFLAGDVEGAIPYLRKATRSCLPLDFPFPFVRASYWLGEALARHGDTEGACEALRAVITRWGDARPRSATATAAKAKAREIGCR